MASSFRPPPASLDPSHLQWIETRHLTAQNLTLQTLDISHQRSQTFVHPTSTRTAATADPEPASRTVTVLAVPAYGHKLSRTVGFGMQGPVTAADLRAIEETYAQNQQGPGFDVCDAAHPSALELLRADPRYRVTGGIVTLACPLHNWSPRDGAAPTDAAETITISPFPNDDLTASTLATASVAGFVSNGRPLALLQTLTAIALQRSDTRLFVARVGTVIAGVAGLAMISDSTAQKPTAAYLYLDSTVPEFRGRGVHAALIRARLLAAKVAGCELAMASAGTGSGSARNLEREGLGVVYNSTMFRMD